MWIRQEVEQAIESISDGLHAAVSLFDVEHDPNTRADRSFCVQVTGTNPRKMRATSAEMLQAQLLVRMAHRLLPVDKRATWDDASEDSENVVKKLYNLTVPDRGIYGRRILLVSDLKSESATKEWLLTDLTFTVDYTLDLTEPK